MFRSYLGPTLSSFAVTETWIKRQSTDFWVQ